MQYHVTCLRLETTTMMSVVASPGTAEAHMDYPMFFFINIVSIYLYLYGQKHGIKYGWSDIH